MTIKKNVLKDSRIDTPLGPMIAIANEKVVYLLEFVERRGLEREVERLKQKTHATIIPGSAPPLCSIEKELSQYFEGKLTAFKTPFSFLGTPFQKKVWEELIKIPFGETRSYSNIGEAIGQPTSYRAVARANGANQLAIIIPCHRVINANGNLCGYGGGVGRKKWLLDHEKDFGNRPTLR
jgi:AraC family transcriptional regulator of adaptative response/methylated-DNA-[protein]-cysteine methyltransferase